MTVDDSLRQYFDDLYNKLHADHVRQEQLALHKLVLAEQLNAHLGLPGVPNPTVDQIRSEHGVTPAQPVPGQ